MWGCSYGDAHVELLLLIQGCSCVDTDVGILKLGCGCSDAHIRDAHVGIQVFTCVPHW